MGTQKLGSNLSSDLAGPDSSRQPVVSTGRADTTQVAAPRMLVTEYQLVSMARPAHTVRHQGSRYIAWFPRGPALGVTGRDGRAEWQRL